MSFFKNMFGSAENNEQVSKIGWIQLTSLEQLNEIIDASADKPVLIFKHSTRCSVSRMVLRQFENEFDKEEKITPYFLDLLEHRNVSNEIADRFGVIHQSPQVIVVKDGKAIYNTSHSDIEAVKLDEFI